MKVMQFLPIPEETKFGMHTFLAESSMPIFKDRTIFILVVLLTVFESESDQIVIKIRNRFLTILRQYLLENTKNFADFDMTKVIQCTESLPRIYKIMRGEDP